MIFFVIYLFDAVGVITVLYKVYQMKKTDFSFLAEGKADSNSCTFLPPLFWHFEYYTR
jgi:hypothetical protein